MRIFAISILLLVNLALEATLFQNLRIYGIKPDITLMIVVSFGILKGRNNGAYIGLAAGLLMDIMFGKVFGIYALAYMMTGYVSGMFNEKVFKDSMLPAIMFNGVAVALFQTIIYLFTYLTNNLGYFGLPPVEFILTRLLPLIVYNGILSGPVYKLIYKFEKSELINRRVY